MHQPPVRLRIDHRCPGTAARAGVLHTPHGQVPTPAFMAVGTKATVKGLTPEQVRATGTAMLLGNTYHLALRPGAELVARMGGLHRFMNWSGPILTDSGGYQVFSLQHRRTISDEGVRFRSHIDGDEMLLTPERAVQIQQELGADVMMCFDECPPADGERRLIERAVVRTTAWARRCRDAQTRPDQALFGIVQGGVDAALRRRSAEELVPLDLPGYAVGGLSVGETSEQMYATLDATVPHLPAGKPRYLMGVGYPADLVEAVGRGIDMFDCVLPTRNGRNAKAFTFAGTLNLKNAVHRDDPRPLDEAVPHPASRDYSRAYLRHLFLADEMLGPVLLSLHNLAFYQELMHRMRTAIADGAFPDWRRSTFAALVQ